MFKLTTINSPVKKEKGVFDALFDDFFEFPTKKMATSFKLDMKEEDGKYVIEADLPGIKKEEVKINYENDHLLIGVERKEEQEEQTKNYLHKERSYESMQRAIYLPEIDAKKIKAKLEEGVLKVTIEKSVIEKKGHTILID